MYYVVERVSNVIAVVVHLVNDSRSAVWSVRVGKIVAGGDFENFKRRLIFGTAILNVEFCWAFRRRVAPVARYRRKVLTMMLSYELMVVRISYY